MSKGQKTGGRKKGVPNKANRELRELAREYTLEAVETLAKVMRTGETDQARAMAADKLLDRGHGKAAQPISGDGENPIEFVQRIERVIVDSGKNAKD